MTEGKVVIVTGANSGLGLETSIGLCQLGYDVIISTRDDQKGKATISHIKAQVPNAQVMYITMELSDPQSIRNFATKFLETGKPLHVLINNGGMFLPFFSSERKTARDDDSLEITMTVNCMGSFLLTNILLDKLKETGTETDPARIVNVSSVLTVHKIGIQQKGFFIDDLMLAEDGHYHRGLQAYRNSKLAMNLWTIELAKKLQGTHVIANTVCPGFIPSTALNRRNMSTFSGLLMVTVLNSFIGRWLWDTEPISAGQDKLIKMATAAETKTSGIFYTHYKQTAEAPEVLEEENQKKIWDLCVRYSTL